MFFSFESVRTRRLPKLMLACGLGAASLGLMGCADNAPNEAEVPTASEEIPSDESLLVLTRQDCLEEYGNHFPFIGDAIVADKKTGAFQQIKGVEIIDRGFVPLNLFEDGALGFYNRFCGTPFSSTPSEAEASQPAQDSKL